MQLKENNILTSTKRISRTTLEVYEVLQQLQAPIHIFAGFGLYLHGIDDKISDGDIRVFYNDLDVIYAFLSQELPDKEVILRDSKAYTNGVYTNRCIEVEDMRQSTGVDICTRMSVDSDFGFFEFPFTAEAFQDVVTIEYEKMMLTVTSLESLLLYYLVLRRSADNNKDDENRIRRILASPKFDARKFEDMLRTLPQADSLLALYKTRQTVR